MWLSRSREKRHFSRRCRRRIAAPIEQWQATIERQIEQLSRAPFFVLNPGALIEVRHEVRRIREGRGTDVELEEDDDVHVVVDNARRLDTKLSGARRGLGKRERTELDLFAAERLVEASLRFR